MYSVLCADASAAPRANASSDSAGANTGTDKMPSSRGMTACSSLPEPTTTNASGRQSALAKTVLSHRSNDSSVSMAWLTAVCTAPSPEWTMSMITVSGSITHTAVTSYPMTSAMPHARASVASDRRTGTTLPKPQSVNDFNSNEASASAPSLHVTPIECNR